MKKNIIFGVVVMLCVVLVGCATVGKLPTVSGRPEVLIENGVSKDVIGKCVSILTESGWQIEQATDYMIQAVSGTRSDGLDGWLQVSIGAQVKYRLLLTFVQLDSGVRIFGVQNYILHKQLGSDSSTELTSQNAYQNTQGILEALKSSMVTHSKISFMGRGLAELSDGISVVGKKE